MPMIGPRTSVADRPLRVTLQNPTFGAPDSEGNPTTTWSTLDPPQVFAKIAPATQADLERVTSGTVISTASHVVTMPYHQGVTTQTRITWTDKTGALHTINVTGVANPEERSVETVAVGEEVVL